MKPFNQRFEDFRLQSSTLNSPGEDSFLFWFENYVNQRKEFNPDEFLTGKVYSFEYNDKLEKSKKFINKRPVVFFTGYFIKEEKNLFSGIDLILMPPMIRIPFFTKIQSVFGSQIETNIKKVEEGQAKSQIQFKTDYETLNTILTGIPFKNSYRVWDLKKVRDIIEIPVEEWTRIVYLHTRAIEGTPIEEIYKKNMQF
jgi:hypothetical protein